VGDFMQTRVETIGPRESSAIALERMRRSRIRHLVVCDAEAPVGIVSDRDLDGVGSLRRVEAVEDVMSRPIVSATPEMTVRDAADLLRGRTIGCLPVVDGGRMVGIVTTTDLLELIGSEVERPVRPTGRRRRGPTPMRGRHKESFR
jgi:acetoin utilization protein AcuB